MFSNSLKNYLKTIVPFNEENDTFIGITSKYLPLYKNFIEFWNTTINNTNSIDFENEFEIDEIGSLFKHWGKCKNNLTDENIIRIIKYFFTNEIVEEKYILNITSSIWNKSGDIENSIPYIKQQVFENHKLSLISFDDLYNHYQKFCSIHSYKFIVSKRYFEKYLYYKCSDYIVYEKFITFEWVSL
jgi:hypothetical protein